MIIVYGKVFYGNFFVLIFLYFFIFLFVLAATGASLEKVKINPTPVQYRQGAHITI